MTLSVSDGGYSTSRSLNYISTFPLILKWLYWILKNYIYWLSTICVIIESIQKIILLLT